MLIIYAILTCFMIAVILGDVSRYLIPNWLVLSLMVLYPVAVYIAPVTPDWKMACVIAVATFAVGYVLFSFRIMGGGDIKLLTALALYAGTGAMIDFLVYVAMIGGGRHAAAVAASQPGTVCLPEDGQEHGTDPARADPWPAGTVRRRHRQRVPDPAVVGQAAGAEAVAAYAGVFSRMPRLLQIANVRSERFSV